MASHDLEVGALSNGHAFTAPSVRADVNDPPYLSQHQRQQAGGASSPAHGDTFFELEASSHHPYDAQELLLQQHQPRSWLDGDGIEGFNQQTQTHVVSTSITSTPAERANGTSGKPHDDDGFFGEADPSSSEEPCALLSPEKEQEQRTHLRRVVVSSIIGNTLEWYDFLVYVYLGSVISRLFFPSDNVYTRLLAYYGIFAAGFLTRPLGALFFGYVGDRWGRKTALMASIYAMSVPTFLMGCLPTYSQVGIAAPVLLVAVRVIQGFAVGGEFTSTMVFLVEHAPSHQRGLYGSLVFSSVMVGVLAGSLVATIFISALSASQLDSWGWRLPFLISILGSAVGVYIRHHVKEPDAESVPPPSHLIASPPIVRVVGGVLTVILIDFMLAFGFYLVVIFLPVYFVEFAHLTSHGSLAINSANMLLYMLVIPLGGSLSDQVGRLPVILAPCVVMAAAAYPLWAMFKMDNLASAWFAQASLATLMAVYTGVLPATFVSLFPATHRCTGLSVGHNISMAAFGGTAPIMATGIIQGTHNIASPAALLIVAAVLSCAGVGVAKYCFGLR